MKGGIFMAINKISGPDVMPSGVAENLKKHAEKVLSDDTNQKPLEKIREESKGVKIDTKA
jgi:hypothetical protein